MRLLDRLVRWLDGGLVTDHGRPITTSVAPLLSPYHVTSNPRTWDHCDCCRQRFWPAHCPITHTEPCPDCQVGAA